MPPPLPFALFYNIVAKYEMCQLAKLNIILCEWCFIGLARSRVTLHPEVHDITTLLLITSTGIVHWLCHALY